MEYVSVPINEYRQLLQYKEVVQAFEEMLHEKPFKKEFVKEVEQIREDVKKGKKIEFKSIEEMDRHLDRL